MKRGMLTKSGAWRWRVVFAQAAVAAVVLGGLSVSSVEAGKLPALALEETLARSSAVLVGTVIRIDDAAGSFGPGKPGALTRVTLSVSQVLHGPRVEGTLDILFGGGRHPDGTFEWRSIVPQLTVGDSYVLRLRPEYYGRPIVASPDALLRLVQFPNKRVVVDADGRALIASVKHGLLRVGKVAASLEGRSIAAEQASEAPGDEEGVVDASTDSTSASLRAVEAASSAEEVLALLQSVIARHPPAQSALPIAKNPNAPAPTGATDANREVAP